MKPVLPEADEIPAIKAGNADLINKYYFANYKLILDKAHYYCYTRGRVQDYMDFAHDVYFNFAELDFTCNAYFYNSLKRSFYWSRCGGRASAYQLQRKNAVQQELYNLDAPVKNAPKDWRDMTVGETIESDFDIMTAIEPPVDISQPLFDFCSQFCNEKQKNVFNLRYWFGMSYNDIAKQLGLTKSTVVSRFNASMCRIRSHLPELNVLLDILGYATA